MGGLSGHIITKMTGEGAEMAHSPVGMVVGLGLSSFIGMVFLAYALLGGINLEAGFKKNTLTTVGLVLGVTCATTLTLGCLDMLDGQAMKLADNNGHELFLVIAAISLVLLLGMGVTRSVSKCKGKDWFNEH